MTTHPSTAHPRISMRLAGAGLITALALSGCQVGTVHEESETVSPTEDTNDNAGTTADDSDADDTTADDTDADTDDTTADADAGADDTSTTADDADADDTTAGDTDADADDTDTDDTGTDATDADDQPAADSGEVAAPGSEFQMGDTVTTHVQAGEEGEEFYGYATVATTIVSVEEGDPALFEEAENAEDFAGYTPWYLVAEHEWLTFEGNPNSNMIPNLVGFNESGGEVSKVINQTWSAGIPGCDLDLPEKEAGNTATSCHVFSVPDGESIGSVGWRGDDWADGGGSAMDNPYYDDPVLWVVP